jgi:hypothetical protein
MLAAIIDAASMIPILSCWPQMVLGEADLLQAGEYKREPKKGTSSVSSGQP